MGGSVWEGGQEGIGVRVIARIHVFPGLRPCTRLPSAYPFHLHWLLRLSIPGASLELCGN